MIAGLIMGSRFGGLACDLVIGPFCIFNTQEWLQGMKRSSQSALPRMCWFWNVSGLSYSSSAREPYVFGRDCRTSDRLLDHCINSLASPCAEGECRCTRQASKVFEE